MKNLTKLQIMEEAFLHLEDALISQSEYTHIMRLLTGEYLKHSPTCQITLNSVKEELNRSLSI
jgi:geranylgeranyl pyrophosphate synthase